MIECSLACYLHRKQWIVILGHYMELRETEKLDDDMN